MFTARDGRRETRPVSSTVPSYLYYYYHHYPYQYGQGLFLLLRQLTPHYFRASPVGPWDRFHAQEPRLLSPELVTIKQRKTGFTVPMSLEQEQEQE